MNENQIVKNAGLERLKILLSFLDNKAVSCGTIMYFFLIFKEQPPCKVFQGQIKVKVFLFSGSSLIYQKNQNHTILVKKSFYRSLW